MSAKKFQADLAHRPRLADLRPIVETSALLPAILLSPAKSKVTPAAKLKNRQGYNDVFLGDFRVPWPTLDAALAQDVYPLANADNRLDYTHFSITMSRSRRLALFVGVNIEGASSVEIDRGRDVWTYDGRLPNAALPRSRRLRVSGLAIWPAMMVFQTRKD